MGAWYAASCGSGVIGIVVEIGVHGILIASGLVGEQGYDLGFLGKLEHCVFGEDVILTEDSGKMERAEGKGVCVGGPRCSRSGGELLGGCCCCPLILGISRKKTEKFNGWRRPGSCLRGKALLAGNELLAGRLVAAKMRLL
jgi:hypothetical protein